MARGSSRDKEEKSSSTNAASSNSFKTNTGSTKTSSSNGHSTKSNVSGPTLKEVTGPTSVFKSTPNHGDNISPNNNWGFEKDSAANVQLDREQKQAQRPDEPTRPIDQIGNAVRDATRIGGRKATPVRDTFNAPQKLKLETKQVRADKRPHCKPRPDRTKGGGGGGGKRFVPWC